MFHKYHPVCTVQRFCILEYSTPPIDRNSKVLGISSSRFRIAKASSKVEHFQSGTPDSHHSNKANKATKANADTASAMMVQITPPMPIDTTPSNAYLHPPAIKRCSAFEMPRLNHEVVLSMTSRATFQTSDKPRLLDLPLLLLQETSFTAYLNNDTQKVVKAMQQVSIHWKQPTRRLSVAPIPRPPLLETKTDAKQMVVVALDDDASETSSANTVDSKTATLAKRVRRAMVLS